MDLGFLNLAFVVGTVVLPEGPDTACAERQEDVEQRNAVVLGLFGRHGVSLSEGVGFTIGDVFYAKQRIPR